MINQNELTRSIRFALLAGISTLAVPAFAQDSAAENETATLPSVEVLGTRIRRSVDAETAQPVLVVTREELEKAGVPDIGTALTNLASSDGSSLTLTNNSTNGNPGRQNVSLRNLGAARTLVLVNGRRWTTGIDGTVDLQTIPLSMIERIEVLKDGASAIYGSDAVAGVVNIITRTKADGVSAGTYYGQTKDGDGEIQKFYGSMGASNDVSSVVLGFSYAEQKPIFQSDRTISQFPVFGGGLAFGSGFPERGRFTVPGIAGTRTLIPGRSGRAAADFQAFTNADRYNFAPVNYLQQPYEQIATFVSAEHAFNDSISAYVQTAYVKRKSSQVLAEVPLSIDNRGFQGPQWQFPVAATNVFNPFGVNLTAAGFRMRALGPRSNFANNDTITFSGGFKGDFDMLDRAWSWDVGAQFLDTKENNRGKNYVNLFNLRSALGPSFRDAGGNLQCGVAGAVIAGCTPFNIFGGPDLGVAARVISQAEATRALDYVGYTLNEQNVNTTRNYTANLTGGLFDTSAGEVAMAVGYEYRSNNGVNSPDSLVSEGGSSTNFTEPTTGNVTINEFYAEINAPILADVQFAERLEINIAGRYSDYSASGLVGTNAVTRDIGDTTNGKFGIAWKPYSDLLIRANYGQTFRAPSVNDLFAGGAESFPQANDPCSASRIGGLAADQRARCYAQGVPTTNTYAQLNTQIRTLSGGNANLGAESGDTKTVGFVYSPSFLENFNIGFDWYKITLEDALTFRGAQSILNGCILDGDPLFCSFIGRANTGDIASLRGANFNAADQEVSGVDMNVSYAIETEYGKFSVKNDTAYTTKYNFRASRTEAFDNLIAEAGGDAYWRIKSNTSIGWNMGAWDATWNMRYLSRLEELCNVGTDLICTNPVLDAGGNDTGASRNILGGTTYHDVQLGYKAEWDGRFSIGARNVFSKDPPNSNSAFSGGFLTGYEIPGSFWYASYDQKF